MTENEAISVLKMIEAHGSLSNKAKDMAIQALEKQMPKKPILDKSENEEWNLCPCCKARQVAKFKYCAKCGQKLDWS